MLKTKNQLYGVFFSVRKSLKWHTATLSKLQANFSSTQDVLKWLFYVFSITPVVVTIECVYSDTLERAAVWSSWNGFIALTLAVPLASSPLREMFLVAF